MGGDFVFDLGVGLHYFPSPHVSQAVVSGQCLLEIGCWRMHFPYRTPLVSGFLCQYWQCRHSFRVDCLLVVVPWLM